MANEDPPVDSQEKPSGAPTDATEAPSDERTPPPERQSFGDESAAWMVVNISGDGLQATLTQISFGGDESLTNRDISTALAEQYDIKHGLQGEVVAEIAEKAKEDLEATVQGNYVVAQGDAPEAGIDGRIEYDFLGDNPGEVILYKQIQDAFAEETVEGVLSKSTTSMLATPGQQLAHIVAATAGTPGRDVYGNALEKPGKEVTLEAGRYTSQNDSTFIADQLGYVLINQNKLSIIPPVWVAPDSMKAYFIHFPLPKKQPPIKADVLQDLLKELGIQSGFVTKTMDLITSKAPPSKQPKARLIARGTAPVHGNDANIDLGFNPEKMAGKVNPDGSIDLRERNSVIAVEEGQLLGTLIQATLGEAGIDVMGNVLPGDDGDDSLTFTPGENVRGEGNPPTQFYALTSGNVHLGKGTIEVKQVFVVSGDVNYEIGNIDTPHDVQINGDVLPGFTIKAGGSITVGGNIESSATLTAQGDIIVARGIIGGDTHVKAAGTISQGSIQTQYVLNASIAAKGDVEIGSYAFNSYVRSNGSITVHPGGGDRGGSIVGGEAMAAERITCQNAGSSTTAGTLVSINPNPEVAAQIAEIDKTIEFCDANAIRLLRTLGLKRAHSQYIKTLLRQAPESKKKVLKEIVKKLYDLLDMRGKSNTEKEELKKTLDASTESAEIVVTGKAFSGIRIAIGESEDTLSADHVAFCFRIDPDPDSDEIKARPVADVAEGEEEGQDSEEPE